MSAAVSTETSTSTAVSADSGGLSLIEFAEPIAGFLGERAFTLTMIDPDGAFYSLRSAITPSLRFILTPPFVFFPRYAPKISDSVLHSLGSESVDDVLTFVILTVSKSLADATANLRAPIAVSQRTRRAVQIVLDDDALSFREPISR